MRREIVGAVLGLALAVMLGGSFFYGGNASKTVSFNAPATSSESGWTLGTTYFWAHEGATLRVEYDTTVRRGAFYIAVHEVKSGPGPHVAGSRYVEQSGKGIFDVPLPETGLYWIILDGTPMGNGYDVSYKASWRIH